MASESATRAARIAAIREWCRRYPPPLGSSEALELLAEIDALQVVRADLREASIEWDDHVRVMRTTVANAVREGIESAANVCRERMKMHAQRGTQAAIEFESQACLDAILALLPADGPRR